MFTDRLRTDRNPFDNYDLREQAAAHIEALEANLKACVDRLNENTATMNMTTVRIKALEFEVEHERYNVEKTAQEAAKRIKALEAALQQSVDDWRERGRRIEALEAALREIVDKDLFAYQYQAIARAPLDQSSPPKTQTPPFNPDDWGDPSSPPEASD